MTQARLEHLDRDFGCRFAGEFINPKISDGSLKIKEDTPLSETPASTPG